MAAKAPAVKLIGAYGSPYVHCAEVALRLKGVPYELILEEDEDMSNKSELLLRHNPVHKLVPVLLHGDRAICESHACIYRNFGRPFWFSFWTGDDEDDKKRAFVKEAKVPKENLALLEAQLKGRRGDTVGFLDIAASGLAHWLGIIEEASGVTLVNDDEFPAFCKWGNAYVNDETVKQCLPDRDDLITFFSARKEMYMARVRAILHK